MPQHYDHSDLGRDDRGATLVIFFFSVQILYLTPCLFTAILSPRTVTEESF